MSIFEPYSKEARRARLVKHLWGFAGLAMICATVVAVTWMVTR